jgi:hypothetical protein
MRNGSLLFAKAWGWNWNEASPSLKMQTMKNLQFLRLLAAEWASFAKMSEFRCGNNVFYPWPCAFALINAGGVAFLCAFPEQGIILR